MRTLDVLLWAVLPYASMAVFVLGTIYRYRSDRTGWTLRASQLPENRCGFPLHVVAASPPPGRGA